MFAAWYGLNFCTIQVKLCLRRVLRVSAMQSWRWVMLQSLESDLLFPFAHLRRLILILLPDVSRMED